MSDPPRLARLFGFGTGQVKVGPLSVRQWVWILAAVSIAVQLLLSYLATLEFRQGAYDLGITVQGLSNVGAGRFFWSTGNHLHHGTVSLLNSHFSWVYFAIYPAYTAVPEVFTLFVVQAIAIGIAVVPLEALATQSSGSARRGLLVAVLYTVWAPMYAGMPNSFHLEAFLPLLFFAFVLVWLRQQYALGLGLAVLAGFTIDIGPILTALLGVVFLSYPLQDSYRHAFDRRTPDRSRPPGDRRTSSAVRSFFSSPSVRACIALLAVSLAVFLAMRLLEANLTNWLGIPGSSLGLFRSPGSALSNLTVQLRQKVEFWLLMGATVGFLPLLYPRILVVLVPWIGYTALQAGNGWFSFPSHYVAIAAVPFFLGIALGIGLLPLPGWLWAERAAKAPARDGAEEENLTGPRNETAGRSMNGGRAWRRRRPIGGYTAGPVRRWGATGGAGDGARSGSGARDRRIASACGVLVLVVVAANVAISPANFATNGLIASTGNPLFESSSSPYGLTAIAGPGYAYVQSLAAELPAQAFVLVQTPLFPLVAKDPNAYILASLRSQGYVEREPFNNSTPPQFVFSTVPGTIQFDQLVANLSNWVWNTSVYGIVGWVQTTPIGSVLLFEKGYTGPTAAFGPVAPPTIVFSPGNGLMKGYIGKWETVNNSMHVPITVISSPAGLGGEVWSASESGLVLPAGNYTLTVELRTENIPACPEVGADDTVLQVLGNASGPSSPLIGSIPFSQAACGAWVPVSLPFTLVQPVVTITFVGIRPLLTPLPLKVQVAQVSVAPAAASTP